MGFALKMQKLIWFLVLAIFTVWAQERRQSYIVLGETITLYCPVHVQGRDFSIKSITWTKDGKPFYQYNPIISDYPITFDVIGVQIEDDPFYNGTTLTIGPAIPQTTGLYRCNAELNHPYMHGFKMSVNVDTELTHPYTHIYNNNYYN